QRSEDLKFCIFFQRHQIKKSDTDRADILVGRPVFIHYKYIFLFQYLLYREIILYSNWHMYFPFIVSFPAEMLILTAYSSQIALHCRSAETADRLHST